jgi:uncharacterized protein
MSTSEKLTEDMKIAMKAGEKERLSTIRLLRGHIKDAVIAKREDLNDEQVLQIISNAAKKRKESIKIYSKAGRSDLADKEQRELEIIQTYLPQQLSVKEIEQIVDETIASTNAQTIKEIGKVMGIVIPRTKGRADGKIVSDLVRQKLG